MARTSPSYIGRQPASPRASAAARGASRKTDTAPEVALRRLLWRSGCRYRKDVKALPGRPDIVFSRARLVVFCDGDFWHGKDWEARQVKLRGGSNAEYWLAKIARNVERDRQNDARLTAAGWTVLRVWESEIKANPARVAALVLGVLGARGLTERPSSSANTA